MAVARESGLRKRAAADQDVIEVQIGSSVDEGWAGAGAKHNADRRRICGRTTARPQRAIDVDAQPGADVKLDAVPQSIRLQRVLRPCDGRIPGVGQSKGTVRIQVDLWIERRGTAELDDRHAAV